MAGQLLGQTQSHIGSLAVDHHGGRTFGRPFSLREGDPQGSYEGRPAVDGKGVVHVTFAGRGRVVSNPSARYKTLIWFARHLPRGAVRAVSRQLSGRR